MPAPSAALGSAPASGVESPLPAGAADDQGDEAETIEDEWDGDTARRVFGPEVDWLHRLLHG